MHSGQLRYDSTKPQYQGKNIMVFCDGTAKDGASGTQEPTNVWQLFKLVRMANPASTGSSPVEESNRDILYIPGIGAGSAVRNPLNLLGHLFGTGIVEIIVQAYLHIAQKYSPGDFIYLFGYSRGAFVARKVASLIFRIGLVPDKKRFLELWKQQEQPVPWKTFIRAGSKIPIQCLAVWDTVGAIYSKLKSRVEDDILGMPAEELPLNVIHAFHVVAFHENRRLFSVTLFKPNGVTQLKEIWFPGAHSDVGGGGAKHTELPKLSLVWVIGELQKFMNIPHDQVRYPNLEKLKPMDAYHESPSWKRLVDRCETRLQSKALNSSSLVHETVAALKNAVLDALDPRPNASPYMLSIRDLSVINWNIKICLVACNAFEIFKRSGTLIRRPREGKRERVTSMQPSQETPIPRSSSRPRESLPSIRNSIVPSPIDERGSRSRASSAYIPNYNKHAAAAPSAAQTTGHRLRVESHAQPYYGEAKPKWSPIASPLRGRDETPSSGIASFQEALSPYGHRQYIASNFTVVKLQQSSGDAKEKRHRKDSSIVGGKRPHYV